MAVTTTGVNMAAAGSERALKRPELLAPAGNLEKLKFAVHYGADAVYIGGQQYGLRSNADNFSFEEMKEGVAFAERYGAKVFVATNIYAHNADIDGLEDYLRELQRAGIAAIIVADPAIIEAAKSAAPKLEIHLSTQQSTMNWQAVRFWKNEGVYRVVLGREASMSDIKEIKKKVDIEIETFVHGAMCSSYSGRCVLSNHFTDRDSNRGGCCQSCRWQYDLFISEEDALSQPQMLNSPEDPQFAMSSKDLCMIDQVPELIEAGIDSFKIEGRMKSIHYVATVVNAYRQAIDAYLADPFHERLNGRWRDEIRKAANRPLTTGFYYEKPDEDDHIYGAKDEVPEYEFAGLVLDYDDESRTALMEQRNHFRPGDTVEFFGPGGVFFTQQIKSIQDEEGRPLDAARHPLQHVKLQVEQPVRYFDIMRLKKRTKA